jgi:hypothetical protein
VLAIPAQRDPLYIFLRSSVDRHKAKTVVGYGTHSVDFSYGAARVSREVAEHLLKWRPSIITADPRDWGTLVEGEKPVTLAAWISPDLSLVQQYAEAA